MTTPTVPTSSQRSGWADELATYLSPGCFPAMHDHLAATLIQRRAPSHLLWHLSVLPRHREFQSVADVVEQVEQTPAPPTGVAGEPS